MGSATRFEFGLFEQSTAWWLGVVVVFGVGSAVCIWLYRRDTRQLPWAPALLLYFLRGVFLASLAFLALDPRSREVVARRRPSRVVVLADRSLSMSLAEQPTAVETGLTRAQRLSQLLTQSPLWQKLRTTHELAVYGFGEGSDLLARLPMQPAGDEAPNGATSAALAGLDLEPKQRETRLFESLMTTLRREELVAAMVVLSDGRSTVGQEANTVASTFQQKQIPIHTVQIGDDRPIPNARVVSLAAPSRVFLGDRFALTATLQLTGMAPAAVTVLLEIATRDGEKPATFAESRTIQAGEGKFDVVFEPTLKQIGSGRATVKISALKNETRIEDNIASVPIEVMDRKTKTLLISSGPGKDYQFLRSLLYRDKSVVSSVLLQSAREDIAQDAEKVLRNFPLKREELFAYDVILAIDVDWQAIPVAGRSLLAEWVGRQAGGLIVVAGPAHTSRLARDESLAEIRELYPVLLRETIASELESLSQEPWPIALGSEGRLFEPVQLESETLANERRWQNAGFHSAYPIDRRKPGASVLLEFGDPRRRLGGERLPWMVRQYFGAGRVFYLASAETWRLRRQGERVFDQFWTRLVRNCAQPRFLRGANRGELIIESEQVSLGSTVSVSARLLDEQYRPLESNRSLPLVVTDPTGSTTEISLRGQSETPGVFSGSFPARKVGETRLQLLAPGSDQILERRIQVEAPKAEFENLTADRATLALLASSTGGVLVKPADLESLAEHIPDRAEQTTVVSDPQSLWDRTWLLWTALGALVCEWSLRKLHRLA